MHTTENGAENIGPYTTDLMRVADEAITGVLSNVVPITALASIVTKGIKLLKGLKWAKLGSKFGAFFGSNAKAGKNFPSESEILRIKNAATRINKPISIVGSRASGKAGAYSDWDYVIHGGLKNHKEWSKIKNSLPGARSVMDNTPRNIDILPEPIWPGSPHITIYPH